MLRHAYSAGLIVLILAVDVSAEKKSAGDQQKIQGRWKVVAANFDGKDAIENVPDDIRFVFSKNRLILESDNERAEFEASFKLETTTDPKLIDVTRIERESKKKILTEGIYKLDGDTLTICAQAEGQAIKERPTKFEPAAGCVVLVLERVK